MQRFYGRFKLNYSKLFSINNFWSINIQEFNFLQGNMQTLSLNDDCSLEYNFKQYSISSIQDTLKYIFSTTIGEKALIIDSEMEYFFNHVITREFLLGEGVQKVYTLKAESECIPLASNSPIQSIIYLLKPSVIKIKKILRHINIFKDLKDPHFYLFCVPKMTRLAFEVLQNQNVYIEDRNCDLNFIPIQKNIFSTEEINCYRDCFYLKETSSLYGITRSLLKLQNDHGKFQVVKGLGKCSKIVIHLLEKMETNESINPNLSIIDEVILFDRDIDMITPFLNDYTFGNALDELIHISGSFITIPTDNPNRPLKININEDNVFSNIQNEVFFLVPEKFKKFQQELNDREEELKNKLIELQEKPSQSNYPSKLNALKTEALELNKIKNSIVLYQNFLDNIFKSRSGFDYKKYQQMKFEILQFESFKPSDFLKKENSTIEYIRDCINEMCPLEKVLSLIILKSQVDGGLDEEIYYTLWRDLIQVGGIAYLSIKQKLEKAGLITILKPKQKIRHFKVKKLINKNFNFEDSNLVERSYNGYTPLSIYLIENLLKSNIDKLEHFQNQFVEKKHALNELNVSIEQRSNILYMQKRIKLIFFVGGCTWGEIAGIRALEQKDPSYLYLIGTTKIINGEKLLDSIIRDD